MRKAKSKTEMHLWEERGKDEDVALPPWYVIRLSGGTWGSKGWFWWSVYCGPPVVFLTRKNAQKKAAELYKQYRPCVVEVVLLRPSDYSVKTFGKKLGSLLFAYDRR